MEVIHVSFSFSKSALRMLRDMPVGVVAGGLVIINANPNGKSVMATLTFIGLTALVCFAVDIRTEEA